ncbi:SPOR domain-containing protein [Marinomonas sp. A79]|uniref:SPOR domain-containing protein n=1 Tax=Marinomonas vulgaris TaxID=2823372 RepID=A0ABS5HCJ5_9GAMM|nr:SPOR domain-containing protein [Marinomonas vulgaris]MBR7889377.1 SPOR domain-containing protein [Marinomonas vulgaris]
MKWFFLFIVLLNAGFLSWHSFVQDKPKQKVESVYGPPVSEKIHLLSEPSAVSDEDYSAGMVVKNNIETALSQALANADRLADDASDVFCPRLETERQDDKRQITQALNALGWPYQEREITGKRPKFWLYIAAPDTPALAERIVKELAAKSIDSFVINRAEMKNRISLGLYSSKARAEASRQKIQNASGYAVDVYEHLRNVPIQQIDVSEAIDERDWEQFTSRFDLTKTMIKVEKNPC